MLLAMALGRLIMARAMSLPVNHRSGSDTLAFDWAGQMHDENSGRWFNELQTIKLCENMAFRSYDSFISGTLSCNDFCGEELLAEQKARRMDCFLFVVPTSILS